MDLKKVVAEVRDIAIRAEDIFKALKPLAKNNRPAPDAQVVALGGLIDEAEATRARFREAEKLERNNRIRELKRLVDSYEVAQSMPGLDDDTVEILEANLEKLQAELAMLLAAKGTDFSSLITPEDKQRIQLLMKQARAEVAAKKDAAAVAATAVSVADLALDIAGKLARAAL